MGADDNTLHEKVCVAQVCEGLVVLGLGIVIVHLSHQPRAWGILWGVNLKVCRGVSR